MELYQGGMDVHGRRAGDRVATRVRVSHGRGPVVASVGLLLQLGVIGGERRLLVLGDGAEWIRAWFESLGSSLQAMISCWWHLRKRCHESMSSVGGAQGSPRCGRARPAGAVVGREGERGDRTSEAGIGVGEESCCGRGTHCVPREAASVNSKLPALKKNALPNIWL